MEDLRKQLNKHLRITHQLMVDAENTRKECERNSWDEGFQRGLVLAYQFGEERLVEALDMIHLMESIEAHAI